MQWISTFQRVEFLPFPPPPSFPFPFATAFGPVVMQITLAYKMSFLQNARGCLAEASAWRHINEKNESEKKNETEKKHKCN